MTTTSEPAPATASREEWLRARKALLVKEKELTRARDALAAERRRLPMVEIDREYRFESPDGTVSLLDLFEGRRQLIVYHFMFDPEWEKGCAGCTGLVDALSPADMAVLAHRETTFVLVSRAPLAKLERYRAERGWSFRWVSSFGSDFNYDFHATLDEAVAPAIYNYRDQAERGGPFTPGEYPGLSVFFRHAGRVHHTYSTFARGCEGLTDSYALLDLTPFGRQEDWEDSPAGWPQRPTYG
jgi:predicted dithiol-disulfide oxidoreductase (DUF899 family)